MEYGYVISMKEEISLQAFYDLLKAECLSPFYMPKRIETGSGYSLENIPEWHGETSTFVVYCTIRTMLQTLKRLPGVTSIIVGADDPVTLR